MGRSSITLLHEIILQDVYIMYVRCTYIVTVSNGSFLMGLSTSARLTKICVLRDLKLYHDKIWQIARFANSSAKACNLVSFLRLFINPLKKTRLKVSLSLRKWPRTRSRNDFHIFSQVRLVLHKKFTSHCWWQKRNRDFSFFSLFFFCVTPFASDFAR